MSFREEFRWKKLGFSDTNIVESRFFMFQWRIPSGIYVLYRLLIAFYCSIWLVYTAEDAKNNPQSFGAYLTTWTYTLETVYFMLHAIFTFFSYALSMRTRYFCSNLSLESHKSLFPELQSRRDEEVASDNEETPLAPSPSVQVPRRQGLPWYAIMLWIVFSSVSAAAIMVSIVFWTVLVPGNSKLGGLSLGNIQLHLINSVLILIEHCVTAFPVHVLHAVYPVIYGIIYLLFSVFYWVDDHSHVMYSILNWNKPGPTVGYVFAVGFVIIPIIHLIMYAIYRLKLVILRKIYL